MNRILNCKRFLVALGVVAMVVIIVPSFAAATVNPGDTMYLSDSAQLADGVSYLFSVQIDPVTNHADLTLLPNGVINLDQIDAIACTPDGGRVYGIDKYETHGASLGSGMMGYYDVANEMWHNVNYVMNGADQVTGIVLAGFSPAGVLYVASQDTDLVYTVNLNTAEATPIGPVTNQANGATVHMTGADLAFTMSGDAYLWTNRANGADAPTGLYQLDMGAITDHIPATYIGSVSGAFFTGIAIRANGAGDLAGSTHGCQIHTRSLLDVLGSGASPHDMYLNGSPYSYQYGDMSNGSLELCTRTIGFYKNHDWMGRAVTICGVLITQDGIGGTEDGQGFLNGRAYGGKPKSTDFSMLFAQLLAAKLNTGNASGVQPIDPAEAWLCSQDVVLPSGALDYHKSFDNNDQRTTAHSNSNQLDTFNNSYEDNCSGGFGGNNNGGGHHGN